MLVYVHVDINSCLEHSCLWEQSRGVFVKVLCTQHLWQLRTLSQDCQHYRVCCRWFVRCLKPFCFEKLEVLVHWKFIEGQRFHLIEQKRKLEPDDLPRIIVMGGLGVVVPPAIPFLGSWDKRIQGLRPISPDWVVNLLGRKIVSRT